MSKMGNYYQHLRWPRVNYGSTTNMSYEIKWIFYSHQYRKSIFVDFSKMGMCSKWPSGKNVPKSNILILLNIFIENLKRHGYNAGCTHKFLPVERGPKHIILIQSNA